MHDVIWNNLNIDKERKRDCSDVLYDAFVDELNIRCPTDNQIKKLFNIIPLKIINEALYWGFSDTVVREQIHLFIRENLELVKITIK